MGTSMVMRTLATWGQSARRWTGTCLFLLRVRRHEKWISPNVGLRRRRRSIGLGTYGRTTSNGWASRFGAVIPAFALNIQRTVRWIGSRGLGVPLHGLWELHAVCGEGLDEYLFVVSDSGAATPHQQSSPGSTSEG